MQPNILTTSIFGLEPGERILWQGRPRQGYIARGGDFLLTPFAAFWSVFTASWEWEVIARQQWLEAVFGIPFVALGVWLLFGRLLYDAYARAHTWYAVTDRRALGVRTVPVAYRKSEVLVSLKEAYVRQHTRGDFTVAFGPLPDYLMGSHAYRKRQAEQLQFARIVDGDAAWDAVASVVPHLAQRDWYKARRAKGERKQRAAELARKQGTPSPGGRA